MARAALDSGLSYFDLTEDVATSDAVAEIAESAADGQIFMPQCGLAPGFISIVANDLINWFERIETVKMRSRRAAAVSDWRAEIQSHVVDRRPDQRILQSVRSDSRRARRSTCCRWKGWSTSRSMACGTRRSTRAAGWARCATRWSGKVRELNYKTVRYVGHRDLMKVMVDELRMSEHREQFKEILERAVPVTFQDVVVTFCTVTGLRKGLLVQKSDARKIYHQQIGDELWSAIQITTAAGICAVLDLHVAGKLPRRGLVKQEQVTMEEFLGNRFGQYYESQKATRFSSSVMGEESFAI